MYKTISKTTSWEEISRAEYGTTSRANDLKKLNNDYDGNVVVYKKDKTSTNQASDDLYLEINNLKIESFIQINLIDSITDIKSAILYLHRIDDIKIFDNCIIILNSSKNNKSNNNKSNNNTNNIFLKGYIKNITPVLNAEKLYYMVQIKSYAGILIDSVVPFELEFINSNLKEIVNQICSCYNINVEFSSNSNDTSIIEYTINNEINNSATARINESCWSFITRLCNSRGLLVRDLGNGSISIGTIGNNTTNTNNKTNNNKTTQSKYSFILGDSTISNWLPLYNYDNLARYYEVYSQFNTNSKELIVFEPIKLPITKRIINNEINEGILSNYANWLICREIGKAIKVQLEINGNLSEINTGDYVNIQNNKIGFKTETQMLIENKIINYPNKTILTLTLPCAYNGILPNELLFI
ncbi:MAG TPA: hypothetical protein VLL98_05215 [Rickettsiales bacterium]|nr:hypothetical protein [Rickettsiales bacterium]